MRARDVWQALASRRYLRCWWPWRAAAYLFAGGVLGLLALLAALALIAAGGVLAIVVIGIPLLASLPLIGLATAVLERRLLGLVDSRPLPHAHRVPPRPGLGAWLRTRYTEPGTWRAFGHMTLSAVLLWPAELLAVTLACTVPAALIATPALFATIGDEDQINVLKTYAVTSWPAAWGAALAGLVALAVSAYGLGVLAGLRAALTRAILTPRGDWYRRQVVELTRSRVRLVEAFEAERSRIERDLHDGAQQRLVALSMILGMARLDAPDGPLADQLSRAQEEAGNALVELRELIRGIHPPLLTDLGLEAAVSDLAARSAIRVEVALAVTERFPPPVESAAYFVVAEALANTAKHSGATRGRVSGRYAGGVLTVEVADDGRGGADIDAGTGLARLADRVSVVGGRLSLFSPPGGPTRVTVEIPCPVVPGSA